MVERAHRRHSSLLEEHYLVGAAQGRSAVRYDYAGDIVLIGEEPGPKGPLGLDVERRREIIEHEQVGAAQQGAGRGGALDLAAGEADTERAHLGVEAVGHVSDVVVEHRGAESGGDLRVVVLQPEIQVVAQGHGEEARHLGRVGGPGGNHEHVRGR